MAGTLFLVVGPSGAGKDTLIGGAREALAGDDSVVFARRAITRPADAGGEAHEAVTDAEFASRRDAGGFMLYWQAHGLSYGIPSSYAHDLAAGRNVVANVSRSVIADAIRRFAPSAVLEITASPEILAERLATRGRETTEEIASRLARDAAAIPPDATRITVVNDGTPEAGVAAVTAALRPGAPPSEAWLRRKLARAPLPADAYRGVIRDIAEGRYDERNTADFLAAVAETLTPDETVDLARVRAEFAMPIRWDADLVVDKHSMGGIPGSRITMVVIPVVAAGGLTIPKTSSRAITSPAGTADAMEVLARVDLDADAVRRVVTETGGCIVWNGRLNHSRVDEVMNAITRPRRIDSLRWSVASILSKKLAAGATHCIIDVPVGPTAKVRTPEDAAELRDLLEYVGRALGLHVEVRLTDGSAPIGRGIGPALEARDVVSVLRNDADAPADLRDKALSFASSIFAFDPAVTGAEAEARAKRLIESGAAFETLERIVAAQGRPAETVGIGRFEHVVAAGGPGTVAGIDCFALAGIARTAGAPADKGAGIDLFAAPGDAVAAGQPLYRIHARSEAALEAAAARAAIDHAFRISAG
jgi:thymidine phosphorylase